MTTTDDSPVQVERLDVAPDPDTPSTAGLVISQAARINAMVVPVDGVLQPGVAYEFVNLEGTGFLPPVVLVFDGDVAAERAGQHMKKVVQTAVQEARRARRVGVKTITED